MHAPSVLLNMMIASHAFDSNHGTTYCPMAYFLPNELSKTHDNVTTTQQNTKCFLLYLFNFGSLVVVVAVVVLGAGVGWRWVTEELTPGLVVNNMF